VRERDMSKNPIGDDVRDEYDFTPEQLHTGTCGKYAERYVQGVNIVRLDPDVAAVFPDSESVNEALRALVEVIRKRERRSA
jgi:hypothetical protein